MKAKWITGLVVIVLAALISSLFAFGRLKHPEKMILGSWKEVSWNYELVDKHPGKEGQTDDPSLEHEIFKNLVIHKSESWKFHPGSGLTLEKQNQEPVKLTWKLKGRGHILQLNYGGDTMEYYQIKELTDKKMVLHFENDIHARGIVKIVFARH